MNVSISENKTEIEPGATAEITRLVASLRYPALPAEAVEFAKHCFLDWLGVTIAGAQEPLVAMLREQAAESVGKPAAGAACTLVGSGGQTSPEWAALINGAASHALDFDDVVSAMGGHPSVPVFPALLAQAERRGASGRAFLTAFIAGFETECRVGALASPGHYARGFHPTGTVGTFGAAAACAHLAGLEEPLWHTAFGLAAAQAAGLKCMFGTMTKPFHAGKAASNGLLAAQLAARGFSAHPAALEAEQGFIATQAEGLNDVAVAAMGETLGITRVLFKYHAACYLTHATIEAITALQVQRGLNAAEVRDIQVTVPAGHLRVCNIQEPATGLEGKFSLRFTAALAFFQRPTGEAAFNDEAVRESELVALRDRVVIKPVQTLPNNYCSDVEIRLNNGDSLRARGDVSTPAPVDALPEQWRKLTEKFTTLVTPSLGEPRARQLIERIAELETLDDLNRIVALLKP